MNDRDALSRAIVWTAFGALVVLLAMALTASVVVASHFEEVIQTLPGGREGLPWPARALLGAAAWLRSAWTEVLAGVGLLGLLLVWWTRSAAKPAREAAGTDT